MKDCTLWEEHHAGTGESVRRQEQQRQVGMDYLQPLKSLNSYAAWKEVEE